MAVLSFITAFGGGPKNTDSEKEIRKSSANVTPIQTPPRYDTPSPDTPTPPSELAQAGGAPPRGDGISARPASTIFSRNPPLMTHAEDTPPELSPIFSFLNIHTNKVYHEGYFLKLNDQDNRKFTHPQSHEVLNYPNGPNQVLIRLQRVDHVAIDSGWNATPSWLERSSRYGMQRPWMLQMGRKSLRLLLTWQMPRSRW